MTPISSIIIIFCNSIKLECIFLFFWIDYSDTASEFLLVGYSYEQKTQLF